MPSGNYYFAIGYICLKIMENNEHTRIGTFCETCRNVICNCTELDTRIIHINPSSGLDNEQVKLINKMVESASKIQIIKPKL